MEAAVFLALFAGATALGIYANRWRRADLSKIDEWGLAGRRFGAVVTWFLQGGSIYTTNAFVAVPAFVFGAGVIGFYSLSYLVVAYIVMYFAVPPLWRRVRQQGQITVADAVREHFNRRSLAVIVALTGVLAMVPYVALQIFGMEICFSEIGLPVNVSLIVATAILIGVTFVSGLRAAALIAIVKDVLVWTTVITAVIYLPSRLGGYSHIFHIVPNSKKVLPARSELAFSTLAFGAGLAQYLYPHSLTGALSSSSDRVVKHNAASLPVYTIMAGLLSLLGYVAIAAGFRARGRFGNNAAVPHLFHSLFPTPFNGYALAAIAIGALIPASVMSIASGSLMARNVYRDLLLTRWRGDDEEPGGSRRRFRLPTETTVAKYAALAMKLMGVLFILLVPTTFIINFQFAGGVWILQTLPTVFLGLFVTWMDWRALLCGWAVGLGWGTALLIDEHFSPLTTIDVGSIHTSLYIGIPAVLANLVVSLAVTGVLRGLGRSSRA